MEANHTFVGTGTGEGFNINIPWNNVCAHLSSTSPMAHIDRNETLYSSIKVGLEDIDYLTAFIQVVLPVAYQYDPQLVLVSAGFDAAKGDFLVRESLPGAALRLSLNS